MSTPPPPGGNLKRPSLVCLVHENILAHQQMCLTYEHTPRKKSTVFRKYLTGQVIESRPSPEHQIREVNKPCLILHKRCIGRPSDGVIRLIYLLSITWRVETVSLHFHGFAFPSALRARFPHQQEARRWRYGPTSGPGLCLIPQHFRPQPFHHPATLTTLHQKPLAAFAVTI